MSDMDAPRFVNPLPQSHPVPNGANANPQPHNTASTPHLGQHGPRHSGPEPYTPLDPYSAAPLPSQAHPPRPYYYIPPMPQPPVFHQYQWPMPYTCNPFTGFPGMGYGMVMPPFLPNPYMEAPGYMFHPPHLPPVDYRRFHHSQVPGGNVPYHHQYRRFRPSHNAHVPREMVNSEAQTEPASGRMSSLYTERTAESGRGTNSTAPSSPGSSSGRQACTEEQNDCPSPDRNVNADLQVDGQGCGRSSGLTGEVSNPCLAKTVQSCVRKPLEMQKRHKGSVVEDIIAPGVRRSIGNCEGWSVASNDSLVPVCSSSDREEEDDVVTKERRVPSTFQEDRETSLEKLVDQLTQSEDQIPTHDKTVAEQETMNEHLTDRRSHESVKDNDDHGTKREPLILHESLSESRKANESLWSVNSVASYIPRRERLHQNGFFDQLDEFQKVCNNEPEPGSLEDSIDAIPQIYFNSATKKMNQSVWSVESLAPYIPSDEWLMQNGMLQHDVVAEEVADEGKNDLLINGSNLKARKKKRLSRRFSMSSVDSVSVCLPSSCFDLYSQNRSPLISQQNSNIAFITPAYELGPHRMFKIESEIKQSKTMVENPTQGLNMEPSEREDYSLASPTVVCSKMKAPIPSAEEGEKDVSEKESSEMKRSEKVKEKQGLNMENSEICAAIIGHNRVPLTSQQNVEVFSTSAIELGSHKRLEMGSQKIVENPARGLNIEPSEREEDSLASPAVGPSEINASIPSAEEGEKDVSEKGSSEPEANQSPNQEALNVIEQEIGSSCSLERLESIFPNNPAKEKSPCVNQPSPNNDEMGQEPEKGFCEHKQIKLEVMDQKMDDVSPSKANMVDCGVQCSLKSKGTKKNLCVNPDPRRIYKAKVDEDTYEIGHVQRNSKKHGQRKNWSQDNSRQRDWQEEQPYHDPWNRPGKPRGGNNGLKQR